MAFSAVIYPRRGNVYLAALDKDRPVVILSINILNAQALDVCVVPITTVQRKNFSMRVPLAKGDGGLRHESWAKCDQVTTLEKTDLHEKPLGTLSGAKFQQIEQQVRLALGL
jgi:mRNA-degrading endonuclease toxin of MazEF toxin-antitoxin module